MRTVAIGILALMCGGCAAPAFDLVSHDPESPWLAGERWVRTESSRATVSASFDRYWLDHLGFEVEVVNQTDAPLVVDPRQFTFSLASSSDDLPRSLQQRFAAEDPARMRTRLEQATPGDGALNPLLLVAGVAVVALAVLAGSIDASPNQDSAYADASDTGSSSADGTSEDSAEEVDPQPVKWVPPSEFDRERDRSLSELLQRVELPPGQSVRGEVWFAARPLRRLLGSAPSSGHGITATRPRAPSDHALTLRTPDALGGQEIQYTVAAR